MKKRILLLFLIAFLIIGCGKKKQEEPKHTAKLPEIVLRENGTPRFIDGELIKTKVKTKDDVFTALNEVNEYFGFSNSKDEFNLLREDSSLEINYYRVSQKYRNVDVYGYELVVATDKSGNVTSISGNYVPNINVNVNSGINETKAKEALATKLGSDYEILASGKYVYIHEGTPTLTYAFTVIDNDGVNDIVMDAKDGTIIARLSKSTLASYKYTGEGADGKDYTITVDENKGLLGTEYTFKDPDRNIIIVDAYGIGTDGGGELKRKWGNMIMMLLHSNISQNPMAAIMQDGKLVYGIEGFALPDRTKNAVSAMYSFSVTYDYYKDKLGRNSFDNNGAAIYVNIGATEDYLKFDDYVNAFWSGGLEKFFFGTHEGVTLAYAIDISGHEFTHAVVQYTANLIYKGEAGALNESYADIMGTAIEGKNFELGESVKIFRDMSNPNKFNDPAIKDGKYYFPADLEHYNTEWQEKVIQNYAERGRLLEDWRDYDSGGVHINSGVPNYAAYLMYHNGAYSTFDEMAILWYNSLFLLTPSSDFEDCALAVIQTAKTLGYSEEKISIIEEAFIETKMLARDYSQLSGKVEDAEAKNALPNVRVTAIHKLNPYVNYTVYTNDKGEYTFEQLPSTDYIVVFEKGKYRDQQKDLYLSKDTKDFNAYLEPIKEPDYKQAEIIFVMDISKSMDDNDPYDIRKQIISNIVSSLDDNSKVALVLFAKDSKLISNFTDKAVDKKIMITDIFNISNDNGQTAISGTNGRSGINTALSLFKQDSKTRKYIIFLTDGMDNVDQGPTYDELIEKATELEVRILTIGLGDGKDLNEAILQKLADETGGKYYYASKDTKLHTFDKRILDEI